MPLNYKQLTNKITKHYLYDRQRRMRCIGKLQPDRLALLEALAVEEKGPARLQWDMGSAFLVNDGTWDQMYVRDS